MLHFLPESDATPLDRPPAYNEAVARLASIRQALRLAEMFEGKPARPVGDEPRFEQVWPLPEARQRCFERRSHQTAAAAEAGLEVLLGADAAGRRANPAAVSVLSDDIARGIAEIEALFTQR